MTARNHSPPDHQSLRSFDVGIWRIVYEHAAIKPQSWLQDCPERIQSVKDAPVIRFVRDVYAVDPASFIICLLGRCVGGIEQSLLIYFSARLMSLIEAGFLSGVPDKGAIFVALALRLFLSFFIVLWRRWTSHVDARLTTSVRMFFEQNMIQAHSADLQANYDSTREHSNLISPPQASSLLMGALQVGQAALSVLSQLLVLIAIARTRDDGMALIMVCLAKPVYNLLMSEGFFTRPYFAYVHDKVAERMGSMWKMAMDPYYAKEIASYTLGEFLVTEYEKGRLALHGTVDREPYMLRADDSVVNNALTEVLNHIPLIYVAANVLIYSHSVALSSILVIEQTSFTLRNTFEYLFSGLSQLGQHITTVTASYSRIEDYHTQQTRNLSLQPYPLLQCQDHAGMAIEFRGVSFRYPGSSEGHCALSDVSFIIKPSSLVVVVGQNGSGKSSLIKLLTGHCHASSGEILVDGVSSSSYRREDLSKGTALLTQDHHILPLSIAENIGLGDYSNRHNKGRIVEAATLGGAANFINKLPHGYEESMEVLRTQLNYGEVLEGPLLDFVSEFNRCTDISGGERQRLAASRAFMRLMSPKTKLVVVDEPTSAMDPIGEYELFQRLRECQAGKTMVFVSHRFGHLTKFADQILCMKDGQLVESGTHVELMALNGEYRKLYDIQAQAFRDDISSDHSASSSSPAS